MVFFSSLLPFFSRSAVQFPPLRPQPAAAQDPDQSAGVQGRGRGQPRPPLQGGGPRPDGAHLEEGHTGAHRGSNEGKQRTERETYSTRFLFSWKLFLFLWNWFLFDETSFYFYETGFYFDETSFYLAETSFFFCWKLLLFHWNWFLFCRNQFLFFTKLVSILLIERVSMKSFSSKCKLFSAE